MHKKISKQWLPNLPFKNIHGKINAFPSEFLVFFSLLVFSLSLFYYLTHYMISEKQNILDNSAFLILQPLISEKLTFLARLITFFGTGSFLIPSYLFIIFYLLRKRFTRYALMVAAIVMSSLFLGWILKPIFHRSRPSYPLVGGAGGYSFPSGHALGGFIFSGVLLVIVWKSRKNIYVKWLLSFSIVTLGLSIGISRIYLHVHYATDVIGSLFVTMAWFSFSNMFFRLIFKDDMHETELTGSSQNAISDNYHFNS
jgi:undecaprenyl-diphosphatase